MEWRNRCVFVVSLPLIEFKKFQFSLSCFITFQTSSHYPKHRKKPVSVQWTEIRDSILSLHFNSMPINLVRKPLFAFIFRSSLNCQPTELLRSITKLAVNCHIRSLFPSLYYNSPVATNGNREIEIESSSVHLRMEWNIWEISITLELYSCLIRFILPLERQYMRGFVSRSDSIRNRMWEMPHVGTNMLASVARACVEFLCRLLCDSRVILNNLNFSQRRHAPLLSLAADCELFNSTRQLFFSHFQACMVYWLRSCDVQKKKK